MVCATASREGSSASSGRAASLSPPLPSMPYATARSSAIARRARPGRRSDLRLAPGGEGTQSPPLQPAVKPPLAASAASGSRWRSSSAISALAPASNSERPVLRSALSANCSSLAPTPGTSRQKRAGQRTIARSKRSPSSRRSRHRTSASARSTRDSSAAAASAMLALPVASARLRRAYGRPWAVTRTDVRMRGQKRGDELSRHRRAGRRGGRARSARTRVERRRHWPSVSL